MLGFLSHQAALLLIGLALAGSGHSMTARESPPCRSFVPSPPPSWVSGGAWTPDGERLALADPLVDKLMAYRAQGTFVGANEIPDVRAVGFIATAAEGIVILSPPKVLWLNGALEVARSADLVAEDEDLLLPPPASWAPSGHRVFAYGEIRFGETWKSGLYLLDLRRARRVRLLRELPHDVNPAQRDLCNSAYSCVAALDGKGYLLLHARPMRILEASGEDLRELRAFPPDFVKPPPLAAMGGAAGFSDFMKRQKALAAAVGLYARGRHLFVLTRRPEAGTTRWELHAIDPVKDQLVASKVLPTRTAHLTVVPGPRWWALVEKGDVETGGAEGAGFRQAIPRIVLVPTETLEAPGVDLQGCPS